MHLARLMTIEAASQYIVKGVLVGDPKADGYRTLDEPAADFGAEPCSGSHSVPANAYHGHAQAR